MQSRSTSRFYKREIITLFARFESGSRSDRGGYFNL
jgi:hypothetical protein